LSRRPARQDKKRQDKTRQDKIGFTLFLLPFLWSDVCPELVLANDVACERSKCAVARTAVASEPQLASVAFVNVGGGVSAERSIVTYASTSLS
jgi:hypothetical protein